MEGTSTDANILTFEIGNGPKGDRGVWPVCNSPGVTTVAAEYKGTQASIEMRLTEEWPGIAPTERPKGCTVDTGLAEHRFLNELWVKLTPWPWGMAEYQRMEVIGEALNMSPWMGIYALDGDYGRWGFLNIRKEKMEQ